MSEAKQTAESGTSSSTPQHQAFLALQTVAVKLNDDTELLFKQAGLTSTQYNVLRILRGAKQQPLTCGDIAGRLMNKDPDVTRLLDRMEKQELIERYRSQQDRRVLLTRLTAKGLGLVEELDVPLLELHRKQFGPLSPDEVQTLLRFLSLISAP